MVTPEEVKASLEDFKLEVTAARETHDELHKAMADENEKLKEVLEQMNVRLQKAEENIESKAEKEALNTSNGNVEAIGSEINEFKEKVKNQFEATDGMVAARAAEMEDMHAELNTLQQLVANRGSDLSAQQREIETLQGQVKSVEETANARRAKDRRIVDRKNFREKVNKLEGKGGEVEVKAYVFPLKVIFADDAGYLRF